MSARKHMAKGFTLVEILIVVVILGILAAIVIPQFTDASEKAQESSAVSQLQTLRSQLELYQVEHTGDYPADDGAGAFVSSADFWADLTDATEADGTTPEAGDTEFGPYLLKEMTNPFEASTTVATAAVAGVGWVYDVTDGSITLCLSAAQAASLNIDSDDYTTY